MTDQSPRRDSSAEPRGFGTHSRGLSGEYALEQGWGLNIEQRRRESMHPQSIDGGSDYDYGAQDFGDEPVNTHIEPDGPSGNRSRSENEP